MLFFFRHFCIDEDTYLSSLIRLYKMWQLTGFSPGWLVDIDRAAKIFDGYIYNPSK
jgi:hypothetical protein